MRQENLRGIGWMIASMAAFAIEDAFLKTVTKQLPVGQVLMMFGAAGLCVFALMARRAGASIFQTHVLTKNMLLRAVFEFFGRLFYVLAIALTPMSSATAILQSAPLFVVLGARIFLREKVDAKTWIAIFLGLFGVLIILRPSAADFSLLSLLALIGTLGFVGRDLFSRTAPSSLTKEVLGFYGFTTMMIAGACYAVWDGKPFVSLQLHQFLMLAAALLAGVFAYTALMTAMRTGSIGAVTPYRYSRLLFGISIGVIVFGEQLDAPMLLGCAIVIGAGLFIGWQNQRRQPAQ
ncbi:MAG: DMT family transporter [Burkholderiales bacterium]